MSTTSSADVHYKLGMAHLNAGNIQLAYVEFQKTIDANPNDKAYQYTYGYVLAEMGIIQEEVEEPSDILSLASKVYNGLSPSDIEDMEKISLDRSHFSRD